MGAISQESSIPILKEFANDCNRSVKETCEIALAKIEWDNSEEGRRHHEESTKAQEVVPYVCLPPPYSHSHSHFRQSWRDIC